MLLEIQMEKENTENMILEIYELKYEELDNIIKEKIEKEKYRFAKVNEEEKNNIKNSIIMKAMYEQGFKDGVNTKISVNIDNLEYIN